jgi:hypothetical protein
MNRQRRQSSRGFLQRFRDNYYRPAIRGITQYIKPITDLGGSAGEIIYATKAFLPYKYQQGAENLSKALLSSQRAVDVGLDVARAPSYSSAIETSKRIIPAVQVAKDLYGTYRHNSLIAQARAQYDPNSDRLVIPPRGSRAYNFMKNLGTDDGAVNRAD